MGFAAVSHQISRVGDAVLASEIIVGDDIYPTHTGWTKELARRLPGAIIAPMAGSDGMSPDRDFKALLRATTRASAADMESHVAARSRTRMACPLRRSRGLRCGASHASPGRLCRA